MPTLSGFLYEYKRDIGFTARRLVRSSVHTVFEKFVCQLVGTEDIPNRSKYDKAYMVRNSTPDAVVEDYWTLENGDEWGRGRLSILFQVK